MERERKLLTHLKLKPGSDTTPKTTDLLPWETQTQKQAHTSWPSCFQTRDTKLVEHTHKSINNTAHQFNDRNLKSLSRKRLCWSSTSLHYKSPEDIGHRRYISKYNKGYIYDESLVNLNTEILSIQIFSKTWSETNAFTLFTLIQYQGLRTRRQGRKI